MNVGGSACSILRASLSLLNKAQWVSTGCSRARSSPFRASRLPQRFHYAARWLKKGGGKRSEASGALYLVELCAEEVLDRFFSALPTLVCLPSSPRSQSHYVEKDGLELMVLLPLLPQHRYYSHAFLGGFSRLASKPRLYRLNCLPRSRLRLVLLKFVYKLA